MGFFFRSRVPVVAALTTREYIDRACHAHQSLAQPPEGQGVVYARALQQLVTGQSRSALCTLRSLLQERPNSLVLHRVLGISYLWAGDVRSAVHHLETALMLLDRAAMRPGSLLRALQMEIEASRVRLALADAYRRLGHRAAVIRCLSPDVARDHQTRFPPSR